MLAPTRRAPRALTAHVLEVRACRLCPSVIPPPVCPDPVVGARMILLGQAPGPREREVNRGFAYTAGTRLFSWFARLGVGEEEFRAKVWITAVARCFPGRAPQGGDRVPSPLEIANCMPYFLRELDLLRPATVIAVGGLAMKQLLPAAPLDALVGKVFPVERELPGGAHAFEVVPLPHPSGRSTWINAPANARLLDTALEVLARSAGWRQTFG